MLKQINYRVQLPASPAGEGCDERGAPEASTTHAFSYTYIVVLACSRNPNFLPVFFKERGSGVGVGLKQQLHDTVLPQEKT